MRLYIRNNWAYRYEVPAPQAIIEVEKLPESPQIEGYHHSLRLRYAYGKLYWVEVFDPKKVHAEIELLKEELSSGDYKNYKFIQGLIPADSDEWKEFCEWCEIIRSHINELEELLRQPVASWPEEPIDPKEDEENNDATPSPEEPVQDVEEQQTEE